MVCLDLESESFVVSLVLRRVELESKSIVVKYVAWWGLGVSGVGVKEYCSEMRGLAGSWCVWNWDQKVLY